MWVVSMENEKIEPVIEPVPINLSRDYTVLFVDDEDFMVDVSLNISNRISEKYLGKRLKVFSEHMPTLTQKALNELVEKYTSSDLSIDILVTDCIIPGGSGIDIIKAFKERKDNAILYSVMSGYTDNNKIPEDAGFLKKPFRITELYQHLADKIAILEERHQNQ